MLEENNIQKKVVGGLIWTYAERFLAQAISLIVTIVLARLIAPEAYGVIAIANVFMLLADTFSVSGLGNSLIQKKDADQLDFSTVFYFNFVFSLFIYVVLFVISNPIASFYNMPQLAVVLKVLGVRIPIASINSVQQAYVSKRMEFKKFFFATLGGTIVSAFVGIWMAYVGLGVWALVAQYLVNSFIDTIVLWFTVKWRPSLQYSWVRMKSLFSYGWKILATSLLINLYSNLQDLIIGKVFTSNDLAYCNKGRQFPSLISTNINTSISKVLFPAISESQESLVTVKNMTRRAIKVGTYVLSPILLGLAAVADPFVKILLTEKWLPCVPYLQIMCVVFLLQPIQTASLQAMKALGYSGLYLKLEIIKKIIGVSILLITVFYFRSVMAVVVGSLITEIFATLINIPVNNRLLAYKYKEQIIDILPSLLIAVIMAVCVYYLQFLFVLPQTVIMLFQVFFGVFLYFGLSIVFKNENLKYIIKLIKSFIV